MNALWAKLRPHILSWLLLPWLVMLAAAIAVAVATGQPTRGRGGSPALSRGASAWRPRPSARR